jgi:hypothetical protein
MVEIYGRFLKTASFQLSNVRNHVETNSLIYMLFFILKLECSFQNFGEVSPDFLLCIQQPSLLEHDLQHGHNLFSDVTSSCHEKHRTKREKSKGKGHLCTGTKALYRPYGP